MKGASSDGVDSCVELEIQTQHVSIGPSKQNPQCFTRQQQRRQQQQQQHLPQHYAPIFSSPAGVLPGSVAELAIYNTALSSVRTYDAGSDPSVDDQAGAGFESVRLARRVTRVKGV